MLDSIIENGVFEIVRGKDREKGKRLINTRWVLNKRFDTDRALKKYKGRCVAQHSKDIKEDVWLKDSNKRRELILKKISHQLGGSAP